LMIRVGKANMDNALALPDVEPMEMGGRRMGGFASTSHDTSDAV